MRVIFTKQAKPSLASHAPSDRISRGGRVSVWELENDTCSVRIMRASVITSRFSRHRRNFFEVNDIASSGMNIIGRRVSMWVMRYNFRYIYFVTAYLPFRVEGRAICAHLRLLLHGNILHYHYCQVRFHACVN